MVEQKYGMQRAGNPDEELNSFSTKSAEWNKIALCIEIEMGRVVWTIWYSSSHLRISYVSQIYTKFIIVQYQNK